MFLKKIPVIKSPNLDDDFDDVDGPKEAVKPSYNSMFITPIYYVLTLCVFKKRNHFRRWQSLPR